uniref:Uncharacterized protein n=1 Tax=Plectus sambesii TaxID=2011161 RepID=A0A914WG97_9BILA
MQTCMKPTISTIGCKDADAPAQVPAGPSGPAGGGPGGATDPTGKYFECVAKCAAGDGCYKKLGCALQITQADDGKINGARQKCIEANGGPNRNPDQEDCKCLAAAGVQ